MASTRSVLLGLGVLTIIFLFILPGENRPGLLFGAFNTAAVSKTNNHANPTTSPENLSITETTPKVNTQSSNPTIFAAGKEWDLLQTDKYHIILMYSQLRVALLCTVESLVSALLNGSPDIETGKSTSLRPALVIVWLSNVTQQASLFKQIRDMVDSTSSKRQVNLVLKEINFKKEIQGTQLEKFYEKRRKKDLGQYGDQNKGNGLRLAIILKYGGLYMDADMLVTNDPSNLKDGLAMESYNKYNNAVFKFHEPYHPMVEVLLKSFVDNYDGDIWGQQGPLMFTRVLRKCMKNKEGTRLTCQNHTKLAVWEKNQFYPYSWFQARLTGMKYNDFMKRYKLDFSSPESTIMIHWWHKTSKWVETKLCKRGFPAYKASFLGSMKSKYCPLVTDAMFKLPKGMGMGYCRF